jgi:hypothetical protein
MAALPQQGPQDILAAFVRGGVLTIIDARAGTWTYDVTVVTDAGGNTVVGPLTFGYAAVGHGDRIVVVDTDGLAWLYEPTKGRWQQGRNIDGVLPGSPDLATNPWKRHPSVLTPA